MDNLLLLSEILLMGICLILLSMNLYTFRLTGNKKVLIISGIFVLLFIQAALALSSEFISSLEPITEARSLMFIDVLVVLIIYMATAKSL